MQLGQIVWSEASSCNKKAVITKIAFLVAKASGIDSNYQVEALSLVAWLTKYALLNILKINQSTITSEKLKCLIDLFPTLLQVYLLALF